MLPNSTPATLDLQRFYPEGLKIIYIKEYEKELYISLRSTTESYVCPECGQKLTEYHAMHHRSVQDLPIFGKRVFLDIDIHEYYCRNSECSIGSVTETFDGFLSYRSRMTERLSDFILTLALETNCESCARIMQASGVKVSGDTIIRMLIKKYASQPEQKCGKTIGVDDFAFKKRQTYGTIIVDEETHEPIAILDGRDESTLKEWLKKNKQVTTVTRDRASAYAKAVEEVLPDCMQVADRFHLHQNLLDAVKKILGREIPATIAIPKESGGPVGEVKEETATEGANKTSDIAEENSPQDKATAECQNPMISNNHNQENKGSKKLSTSKADECKKNAVECG